jgi:hypothetical protein
MQVRGADVGRGGLPQPATADRRHRLLRRPKRRPGAAPCVAGNVQS